MTAWAQEFAQLAIRCTQPGVVVALEAELLPALQELSSRLGALGTSAMSWEQVRTHERTPTPPTIHRIQYISYMCFPLSLLALTRTRRDEKCILTRSPSIVIHTSHVTVCVCVCVG